MLLELLFAMSCKDVGNQQACEKAMEAGTKQYEVYQTWNRAEYVIKNKVTNVTGQTVWAVGGAAYKTYREKAVTLSFQPKDAFVDKVTTKAGYDRSGSVNLEWRF